MNVIFTTNSFQGWLVFSRIYVSGFRHPLQVKLLIKIPPTLYVSKASSKIWWRKMRTVRQDVYRGGVYSLTESKNVWSSQKNLTQAKTYLIPKGSSTTRNLFAFLVGALGTSQAQQTWKFFLLRFILPFLVLSQIYDPPSPHLFRPVNKKPGVRKYGRSWIYVFNNHLSGRVCPNE